MSSIKLISLNIEMSKHLDAVTAFLEKERADVVCVQELFEHDIPRIESAIQSSSYCFAPMSRHRYVQPSPIMGVAIFSTLPMKESSVQLYSGNPSEIPDFDWDDPSTYQNKNHSLVRCDVGSEGATFSIGTTHFTWTPNGKPDAVQRRDIRSLLLLLSQQKEFVLCGDFNAPRGGEIWGRIAAKYKDNIPAEYRTSIDINLHRAGKERSHELADKMVDGLFTTSGYTASDVRLEFGVSDHAAIVATVSRLSD